MNRRTKRATKSRTSARLNDKKKRKKYKKRRYIVYYMMVFIFLISTLLFLSLTVLFNIKTIEVKLPQESPYYEEEIIAECNISEGDNLILLNKKKLKHKILNNFQNIDEVKISKIFPNKLLIKCELGDVEFCCEKSDGTYVYISKKHKILSDDEEDLPSENCTVVRTYTNCFDNCKAGKFLTIPEDEQKKFKLLETAVNDANLDKITEINLVNESAAYIIYDDRIKIEIESLDKAKYIIKAAATIVKDNIGTSQNGRLIFCNKKFHFIAEEENLE